MWIPVLDIKKCKNDSINTLKHVTIYVKLIYSDFVASSVTIDDKLRIRIKLLAAKFDTTQGEIINQAVTLFEETKNQLDDTAIESSREIIKKDLLKHKTPTWRKKIRAKLQESGIDIDDLRIELNEI